jgi:hypothetical protein
MFNFSSLRNIDETKKYMFHDNRVNDFQTFYEGTVAGSSPAGNGLELTTVLFSRDWS